MTTRDIAEVWARIEQRVAELAPETAMLLHPGATPEAVDAVERVLGVTFPADLRASYLRHDGTEWLGRFGLLSLRGMLDEHQELMDGLAMDCDCDEPRTCDCPETPGQRTRSHFNWYPAWLPVFAHPDGSTTAVDLDPTADGTLGQVIDADAGGPGDWVAPDFTVWLADTATRCLESGEELTLVTHSRGYRLAPR